LRTLFAFHGEGERVMTKVKLERWQAHLSAVRDQGISIARYAREHGLSRFTLYAAQRQWRNERRVPARQSRRHGSSVVANASPFVRVDVAPPAALLRARLCNGVELEFGNVDSTACTRLVGMLAALPCSG